MQSFLRKCFIPLFIISLFFISICSRQKTDEDHIRELMKEAGKHIENKDLPSLMNYLSDDYSDFRGRNKSQTRDMVQSYFSQFRGIVVHVLSTRIDEIAPPEATIQTDAALSSGAATALRRLIRVSTDNYRFKIKLIKRQNSWLIQHAEWNHIGLEELFPESLSILQKLFPDK